MRIGMILDEKFPPDPRVENEARLLIRQGHQVFLFCLDYTGKQAGEELVHDIIVQRRRYPKWVHKLSALAYSVPLYHLILRKAISTFIRRNQLEILHVHDLQIARAAFMANREAALPVFLDLHENRPEIMKYYRHLNRFPGKFLIKPSRWKKKEARYILESTRTLVVTEEAAAYYQGYLPVDPEKFLIVPNTVSRDFYSDYQLSDDIISRFQNTYMLLYIGDTGERRGLETLIEAVAGLEGQIPDLRLCILGKSTHDGKLRQLAKNLGIKDKVDFEGWQPPQVFPSYILSSRVCTCPILRNIHHDTTYANKLFQYASLGKPLLVSDCTAQKNLVEKHRMGLVFQAGNAGDCADKILRLVRQPEEALDYGKNGMKAVEDALRWEKVSLDLIKAYRQL